MCDKNSQMYFSCCRFEVDQSILIVSFGFPAPDIDDAAYDVALQVQVQGSSIIIAQTNQSLAVKRRSIICVKFDKPVRVEPNVIYKVVYKLKVPLQVINAFSRNCA